MYLVLGGEEQFILEHVYLETGLYLNVTNYLALDSEQTKQLAVGSVQPRSSIFILSFKY